MRKKAAVPLRLDVRDARLPGGRLNIRACTTAAAERDARRAVLGLLVDAAVGGNADANLLLARLRKRGDKVDATYLDGLAYRGELDTRRLAEVARTGEARVAAHGPPMLAATAARFLQRLVSDDSAPGTIESYQKYVRDLERFFGVQRQKGGGKLLVDVPLTDFDPQRLDAWLGERKARGGTWSPNSRSVAYAVALQVFNLGVAEDEHAADRAGAPRYLLKSPFGKRRKDPGKVVRPTIRQTRHAFLNRSEAARLLWSQRHQPLAAYLALGIYAGLRPGERANLRTDVDLDLRARAIQVQTRKGEHPWRVKSRHSLRTVPVSPRLARWLRLHAARGYAGQRYFIVSAGLDRPASDEVRRRWVIDAYKAVGIKYGGRTGDGMTDHTLRHTFASWLAANDVQLAKIARLMGITSAVAERHYIHLTPQGLEQAVALL